MEDSKSILNKIIIISVPIVIQNLLTRSFGIIDSVMVGSLGINSIAGISICNQMYSYGDLLGGICGGVGIFISQYNGSNQISDIKKILAIGFFSNIIIATILTIISLSFKMQILSFFTNDEKVLQEANEYFSIFLFSYIFTAGTYCLSRSLKSLGKTIFPLIFTLIALFTNTILNYLLIFGKLGLPKFGTQGAAIATLISRFIEFLLYFILINLKEITKYFWKELTNIKKTFVKKYIEISLPITLQTVSWASGCAIINLFYAKMGTASFAALNIIWIIEGIVFSMITGLSVASSCIIGEEIGKSGESYNLHLKCKFILSINLFLTILLSILIFFQGNRILKFYNITDEVISKFNFMKSILAIILPIKTLNSVLNQGILKAGADTKYTFYAGLISMWGICIPLQLIIYSINNSFTDYIYVIAMSEEIFKFIFYTVRYKSNKWIKKLSN